MATRGRIVEGWRGRKRPAVIFNKKEPRLSYTLRKRTVRLLFTLGCGGAMTQLSCNLSVSDAIIQGLETLSITFANTLITAAFAGLEQAGTSTTP